MITSFLSAGELESRRPRILMWQLTLQSWALSLSLTALMMMVVMASALGCYEGDGNPIHKAHSNVLAFSMSLLDVHYREARLCKQ